MSTRRHSGMPKRWEMFLEGWASIADIWGIQNIPTMPDLSDKEALRRDWKAVGGDLEQILESQGAEIFSNGRKRRSVSK